MFSYKFDRVICHNLDTVIAVSWKHIDHVDFAWGQVACRD